ncbi:MAG TPA: DUF3300 domain-containing protein [Stenotrophomonas sp.]|jgi:hypothetical protein
MRISILAATCLALLAGCSREAGTADAPSAPATASTAAAPAAAPAAAMPAPAPAPRKESVFSEQELDQMVAPIALYPDPLLAQVLMAATYPGDVADAATWSRAHAQAKGDEAVQQVANEPWDPSVQSLVAFPQALAVLGQDPAWVQRLGDAFLAQPDEVMDAVQRLRRQAQTAGNLASNQYQQVSSQPAAASAASGTAGTAPLATGDEASETVIVIQPSNPQVVYVPSYNPTTVYGAWAYPAYPPAYYPPPASYYPAGTALVSGLMFGAGLAITNSLWGDFDWGHNDVDIDINRYNNINVNRRLDVNQNRWEHNPAHRDGVPYRDQAHRADYGHQLDGARSRDAFRGDDPQRAQAREQAREKMGQHGLEPPARNNQQARERAQAAGKRMPDRDAAAREHAGERLADRDSRAGAAGRDPAHAAGDRARAHPEATRERAAAAAQAHPQARERAANAAQRPPGAAQRAQQQPHRQVQHNDQARAAARTQAQHTQRSNNSAMSGVRQPAQSRAQAQRGATSHAAAQRPANARPAGHPVNRTASAPRRQGGGGRHR